MTKSDYEKAKIVLKMNIVCNIHRENIIEFIDVIFCQDPSRAIMINIVTLLL